MDYLYSLYDALISINVPNDKARAVVDAMERDMGTTIATKVDLQLLRQELTAAMTAAMAGLATREEMQGIKAELKAEIAELRKDNAIIHKDIEHLPTTMTVRTGSMIMFGMGLLFAALKLT